MAVANLYLTLTVSLCVGALVAAELFSPWHKSFNRPPVARRTPTGSPCWTTNPSRPSRPLWPRPPLPRRRLPSSRTTTLTARRARRKAVAAVAVVRSRAVSCRMCVCGLTGLCSCCVFSAVSVFPGRGGDRPYAARGDGESNPHKREYDGHVSRSDYVRGGGRGRGGRGGAKREGAGRFNTGVANEVAPEQSTEAALNALPAGDESPAAEAAEPVEPEEVDTTITLMQFMELQKAKAKLEDDVARNLRRAGEEIVEEDFQNAKLLKKANNADDVLGAGGKIEKALSGGSGPKQLVEKKSAAIDVVFSAPAGGRGGRGGYGAPRGGFRGGRGGYGANPVNITDNKAFPTLGK